MITELEYTRKLEVFDSNNISQLSYAPDKETLNVKFISGKHYTYFKVSFNEFGKLASAESVGKVFNSIIRGIKLFVEDE
jgi:hypothetical protein